MMHCFSGGHGGIPGQGYSYGTIATSVTAVEATSSARSGTLSGLRKSSIGVNGRPIVDRRYSPPPRHRTGTNPTASQYASLPSGLTLPRTAGTKNTTKSATEQPDGVCKNKRKPRRLTNSNSKSTSDKAPGRKKSKSRPEEEKKDSRRQSLNSSRSKMTDKSRSDSVTGKKRSTSKSQKKSKGGWGCFG